MNPDIRSVEPLYPSPAFYQTVTLDPFADKATYVQGDTVSFQFPSNAFVVPNSLKLEFDARIVKTTPSTAPVTIEIPNVTGQNVNRLFTTHDGTKNVTVPPGSYATVQAFLNAVAVAWDAVDTDMNAITYSSTTNQITYNLQLPRANPGDWTILSSTGAGGPNRGYGSIAWLLGFDVTQDLVISSTQTTLVRTLPHTFFQRVGTNAPVFVANGTFLVNGFTYPLSGTFSDPVNLAMAMQAAIQRTGAPANYYDISIQVANERFKLESPQTFSFNPVSLASALPFATLPANAQFESPDFSVSSLPLTEVWTFDILHPRFQTNILSCFQRAFLRYNYDLVIEDVHYFGRIQRLLTEISSSLDQKSSEGNVLSNTSNYFTRLDIGQRLLTDSQRFSVTLPLGFFSNPIPLKYMMDRALMLDMTLRADTECFLCDVPTHFQRIEYSRFKLVYDAVELPPEQDALLYKQIESDGLKLPFASWTWDVHAYSNVHEELNFRFPQIGCALFMLSAIYADQPHLIMDADCTFSIAQPSLLLPYGTNGVPYSVTAGDGTAFLQKYHALVDELIVPERGVDVHKTSVGGVSNAAKAFHHVVKTMSKCCSGVGQGLDTYRWANLFQQTRSGTFTPDFVTPTSPTIANRDIDTVNAVPFTNVASNACPQFCMAIDFIHPETKQIGTNLDEKRVVQLHLDFNKSYAEPKCSIHSFLCHQRTFVLMDRCNAAVLH